MYDSRTDKARKAQPYRKELAWARRESRQAHRREARALIAAGRFDEVSTRFVGTGGMHSW